MSMERDDVQYQCVLAHTSDLQAVAHRLTQSVARQCDERYSALAAEPGGREPITLPCTEPYARLGAAADDESW